MNMAICGKVRIWAHNLYLIPKPVFNHYDIAKEFGFQPVSNAKQMKNHRPTLSYSVLTFCELNNEKYDYSFVSGKIKKRISNLKQGKQWAPIIPTAQLLVHN